MEGAGMQFVTKTPIEKGWSGDKKFCAVSPDGNKYFLRIAPLKKAERTRGAFEYQKRVAELGVPMCVPLETLEKICAVLDCTLDDIVEFSEDENKA
jgi:hypothetical protein